MPNASFEIEYYASGSGNSKFKYMNDYILWTLCYFNTHDI